MCYLDCFIEEVKVRSVGEDKDTETTNEHISQ